WVAETIERTNRPVGIFVDVPVDDYQSGDVQSSVEIRVVEVVQWTLKSGQDVLRSRWVFAGVVVFADGAECEPCQHRLVPWLQIEFLGNVFFIVLRRTKHCR